MMKKNIIFKSVAVLCVLACILSAGQVIRIKHDYKQGVEEYNHLDDILVSPANTSIYVTKNDSVESETDQAPIDVNF